ncbi:MAG: GNAT family N-acetyltransferase [Oligoflexales bacterium]
MTSISICAPKPKWKEKFLTFGKRNEVFHIPWVTTPNTDEEFFAYLERYKGEENISYWALKDNEIVGVINLNNIILGKFRNAFLGYYGSKELSGKGFMSQGMNLVLQQAFNKVKLHRVECAIQPGNTSSLSFIRRLGFNFEGYAPKYLNINGDWKDHFKWSLTKEQWSGESFTSGAAKLSEYDSNWPQVFDDIRQSIIEISPVILPIEHIGSTAVPNLAAKPVIDMQVGVEDFKQISRLKSRLENLGLEFVNGVDRDHVPFEELEFASSGWEKRFFRGEISEFRVNVHIRIFGNPNWRFALLFRDFLRANEKALMAYEQVKRRLSELCIASGIYAYTKDPVCDLIYLQAEEWATKTNWKGV